MTRLFDICVALAFLILISPLLIVTAIGIALTSPGPIFYMAKRAGRGNVPFTMYKFRTMHHAGEGAVITGKNDARIFPLGNVLRRLKIDELPQFLNVLRGDMSIVGPRPEDPKIVEEAYTDWMMKSLDVLPGMTSAGSIYYYHFGEHLIDDEAPEQSYISNLLPVKLAIDLAYLERATLFTNIGIVFKTLYAVAGLILGFRVSPDARDMQRAAHWADIPDPDAS